MAIDFPSNPTNGQVYGNWIYDSSITSWRNVKTDSGIGTLNAMGLKNVVPTSVNVSSGSATFNSNGVVSFNSVSSVILNNVFTSTYKNYRVIVTHAVTGDSDFAFRACASGSSATTGYYQAGIGTFSESATASYRSGANIGAFIPGYSNGADNCSTIVDVFRPKETMATSFIGLSHGAVPGSFRTWQVSGTLNNSISYDGISLSTSVGLMTGTMQVFGYTN